MSGVTYDTGALIAAEHNNRALWALHKAALQNGMVPTAPAGVLAEAWRGGPQHQLSRLLEGVSVEDLTQAQARAIGVLAGKSGLDDTVDLAVAEGAMRRHDIVVTSNPGHITHVAHAAGHALVIHTV